MIQLRANPRGLLLGEFKDLLGQECSIQEASETSEDCIWLGMDKNFEGEFLLGRMKLSKELAKALIPLLRSFVSTGSLEELSSEAYKVGTWVKGMAKSTEGIEGRVVGTSATEVVIQDNLVSGVNGQLVCSWEAVSVLWEPSEKPDYLLSRLERIRTGDI